MHCRSLLGSVISSFIQCLILLSATQTHAADITFSLAANSNLPAYNPSALPSSTKATLFRHSHTTIAQLTRRNTFEFRNLSQGSWLFTVQCRDYTFGPLRVDVLPAEDSAAATSESGGDVKAHSSGGKKERVEAFQTFWGNEWGNKGEYQGGGIVEVEAPNASSEEHGIDVVRTGTSNAQVVIPIYPLSFKEYYMVRMGFSPLQFLKNPMILMGLFSLVMIVGIPYITDNMDEETRAEFEEMQRKSPVAQATSGAGGLQNFDLAGWMAGKTTGSTPRSSTPAAS